MAPFFKNGMFGFEISLVVALFIGIGFGFFLERGGLGNARKLAGQFYLTDFTVFKMMFTAIVTTVLGLFWLSWIGFLDLSLIYINPTYVLPHLIGGLIFGVGFVVGGLCPGTSCVAMATGKLDGLALFFGLLAGIFLFGETFEYIYDFLYSTSMGPLTFPELINIPQGLAVLFVVVIAVSGFLAIGVFEKRKRSVKKTHE
ncbi:MAG: YeeE/YedE family protein [Candidatus Aminicenantes bacterium]|nr:YeeE/YedE family protein [Candidatus Aminicenantes bacterium]